MCYFLSLVSIFIWLFGQTRKCIASNWISNTTARKVSPVNTRYITKKYVKKNLKLPELTKYLSKMLADRKITHSKHHILT